MLLFRYLETLGAFKTTYVDCIIKYFLLLELKKTIFFVHKELYLSTDLLFLDHDTLNRLFFCLIMMLGFAKQQIMFSLIAAVTLTQDKINK